MGSSLATITPPVPDWVRDYQQQGAAIDNARTIAGLRSSVADVRWQAAIDDAAFVVAMAAIRSDGGSSDGGSSDGGGFDTGGSF